MHCSCQYYDVMSSFVILEIVLVVSVGGTLWTTAAQTRLSLTVSQMLQHFQGCVQPQKEKRKAPPTTWERTKAMQPGKGPSLLGEARIVGDVVPWETILGATECFETTDPSTTRALERRKSNDSSWAPACHWEDIVEHMLCSRLLTGWFSVVSGMQRTKTNLRYFLKRCFKRW